MPVMTISPRRLFGLEAEGAVIACSGRTQLNAPGRAERSPQRIDFGHGNVRMMTQQVGEHVERGPARFLDQRDVEIALLVGSGIFASPTEDRRWLSEIPDRCIGPADGAAPGALPSGPAAAPECRARSAPAAVASRTTLAPS